MEPSRGASDGRSPHAFISGPRTALLADGWVLSWHAVRRRVNMGADALATEGVFRAARLAARGVFAEDVRTHWQSATGGPNA